MITVIDTPFEGLKIIEPRVFGDARGYFAETWNAAEFARLGLPGNFVQDNESRSGYGVIRGLHWQAEPCTQTKLVRVIEGAVLDVVVDLRKGSAGYGKHFGVELTGENHRQFLIPRGFAHGFAVLSPMAVFCYKVDRPWAPQAERCLRFDDPALAIDWPIPPEKRILSPKDLRGVAFAEAVY